jgi:hypothetical protein
MKMVLSLFSLALSFSALASTVDTKTFVYDGSVNSVELLFRTEKTHTEYRVENRQSTCYRQEIAGYRRICTGGPGYPYPHPYPGPGRRHPRPYPGPVGHCWSEPVYRTIPYSCIETVRIPFEVKDYDVDARVIVDVTKVSPAATPGETFKVTLNGDSLSFDVAGSRKFFIVKKKQDVRATMSGSVKMMDAVLAAELVEASPVLKAINMSDISMNNGVLNFNLGPVEARDNIGFSLKVVKVKTFGSDTTLLDRELLSSEVELNGSEAGVNVSNLGVQLSNGKFSLTAKAFAKFDGNLMNASQFTGLSDSKTLIYKIR